jgi:hypothetical protein
MRYMALGVALGAFNLLSPDTVLPGLLDEDQRMEMARKGMLAVSA